MALTAQFGGGSLPTGWSFVQNGAANATIDNSGESADILIPAGTTSDSIFSTSSSDGTAGLEHSVSGDFDIAVRVSTVLTGDATPMFGFILRGATVAEMIRWSVYGNGAEANQYGYQRAGGSGSTFQGAGSLATAAVYLGGAPAWYRVVRSGTTYTFYASGDGALWNQHAQGTSNADPGTLKLSVGSTGNLSGVPVRIDEVVDLDAAGTTDARGTIQTTYTDPASVLTTDFTTLPSWLVLDTTVDGTATHGAGYVELSTATADGSSGRLTYSGTGYVEGGLLLGLRVTTENASAYIAAALAVNDGGGNIDVYMGLPGYGFEILAQGSGDTTVPIRVHRPASIDLFDEPYTFLAPKWSYGDVTSKVWVRLEKFGSRMRMRTWLDSAGSEPSTWDYDAEEDTLRGEGLMEPYVSIGHNPGAPSDGAVRIEDLTFYEVSDTKPTLVGAAGSSAQYVGSTQVLRSYVGTTLVFGSAP